MSKSRRTVLVVGCGSIGQRHARLFSARSDVELWVCDKDKARLVEVELVASAKRIFDDYERALTQRPSVVWVCTPDRDHAPVAMAAMRAGSHVFCEKPLADELVSAQAIVRTVHETGRLFTVGYCLRCEPGMMAIRSLIDQGTLGTLVAARANVGDYRCLELSKTGFYAQVPDTLVLDHSHDLDWLRWYFGKVSRVSGFAGQLGEAEIKPSPNVVQASIQFESGALAGWHVDYVQNPGTRRIDVIGDRGAARYECGCGRVELKVYGRSSNDQIDVASDRDGMYRAEQQHFLDAVDDKHPPLVSADDGLNTLRVAWAIIDSYREGKVVRL